jgi:hypothetical protein
MSLVAGKHFSKPLMVVIVPSVRVNFLIKVL